jgi:hypothetical protein
MLRPAGSGCFITLFMFKSVQVKRACPVFCRPAGRLTQVCCASGVFKDELPLKIPQKTFFLEPSPARY